MEPAIEIAGASNRRAQPVRRARTRPVKPNAAPLQSASAHDILHGATPAEQPIPIFPAIMYFADTINALPKELVRHFTLLKEVDAKIFAPEDALFQLIDAAVKSSDSDSTQALTTALSMVGVGSVPMSTQGSIGSYPESVVQDGGTASVDGSVTSTAHNPGLDPQSLMQRQLLRQLYRQVAFKISEMLVSLEEKNHVISTANEALSKHLANLDDVWPHLEQEFSDEAKWGSDTHWAYPENRAARNANSQAERTRREGAASLAAAAQIMAVADAAARSDARTQAVAANKKSRRANAQVQASDLDDLDGRGKADTNKKTHKRKTATASDSPGNIGLGISAAEPLSGNPAKRRKVEKPAANGGAPMERALSSVFGNKEPKVKPSGSPHATPIPDNVKKPRKALPTASGGQSGKRNGHGAAVSAASSPVIGTFGEALKPGRASPMPTSNPRPASSRARQNSMQSNAEPARPRSTHANASKLNGSTSGITAANGRIADVKLPVGEPAEEEKDPDATMEDDSSIVATAEADGPVSQRDTIEPKQEAPPTLPLVVTTLVTTKSGRTSKPSTPALGSGSFENIHHGQRPSSRPSRNSETSISKHDTNSIANESTHSSIPPASTPSASASVNSSHDNGGPQSIPTSAATAPPLPPPKRSHKKGASNAAALAAAAAQRERAMTAASENGSSGASTHTSHSNGHGHNETSHSRRGSTNKRQAANLHTESSKHEEGTDALAVANASSTSAGSKHAVEGNGHMATSTSTASNGGGANSSNTAAGAEGDENEPTYCYCNGVSYGEMVGCDGANCEREWFHLECVGLRVAPKENVKWYCDKCKETAPVRRR